MMSRVRSRAASHIVFTVRKQAEVSTGVHLDSSLFSFVFRSGAQPQGSIHNQGGFSFFSEAYLYRDLQTHPQVCLLRDSKPRQIIPQERILAGHTEGFRTVSQLLFYSSQETP